MLSLSILSFFLHSFSPSVHFSLSSSFHYFIFSSSSFYSFFCSIISSFYSSFLFFFFTYSFPPFTSLYLRLSITLFPPSLPLSRFASVLSSLPPTLPLPYYLMHFLYSFSFLVSLLFIFAFPLLHFLHLLLLLFYNFSSYSSSSFFCTTTLLSSSPPLALSPPFTHSYISLFPLFSFYALLIRSHLFITSRAPFPPLFLPPTLLSSLPSLPSTSHLPKGGTAGEERGNHSPGAQRKMRPGFFVPLG